MCIILLTVLFYIYIYINIVYIYKFVIQFHKTELLEARNNTLLIFEIIEPGYSGHTIDPNKCLISE